MRAQDFVAKLEKVSANDDGYMACCPAHEDSTPSLSVKDSPDGKVLVHCFAGCTFEEVCAAAKVTVEELGGSRLVKTYEYQDAAGKVVYRVERYEPKTFKQAQPDGKGGWLHHMQGVTLLPYRLPELLDNMAPIWVCEGEKDCDAMHAIGLKATCNPGGAEKWKNIDDSLLGGRDVVIVADKDKAGALHAQQVAFCMRAKSLSLKVIEVPVGKDAFDFISSRRKHHKTEAEIRGELQSLADAAKLWEAPDAGAQEMIEGTERWLAGKFVLRHLDSVRYWKEIKSWMCWDEPKGLWIKSPERALKLLDGTVDALLIEVAEKDKLMAGTLSGPARTAVIDRLNRYSIYAKKFSAKNAAMNVLALAAMDERMLADAYTWDQDGWLLHCENGTLDLRTGLLRQHSRLDFLSKTTGVVFDRNASSKVWEDFLKHILPDPSVRAYVQRLAGYSLTGVIREHKVHFCIGVGANGKSTLFEAMAHAMGDYSNTVPASILLQDEKGNKHPCDKMTLLGRRLCICTETPAAAKIDEQALKQITGADEISGRGMFENWTKFKPTHKLVVYTNHKPKVRGSDNGIWRRLTLIPFAVVIPPEQWDLSLSEKLDRDKQAILAWMAFGCREYWSQGLNPPKIIADATQDYRDQEDDLSLFLSHCTVADGGNAETKLLYTAYINWCLAQGIVHPFSQKTLSQQLGDKGFPSKTACKSGAYFKIVKGLSLKMTNGSSFPNPSS